MSLLSAMLILTSATNEPIVASLYLKCMVVNSEESVEFIGYKNPFPISEEFNYTLEAVFSSHFSSPNRLKFNSKINDEGLYQFENGGFFSFNWEDPLLFQPSLEQSIIELRDCISPEPAVIVHN